jgi:hypothetical protein
MPPKPTSLAQSCVDKKGFMKCMQSAVAARDPAALAACRTYCAPATDAAAAASSYNKKNK